jgi:hypothetical protein
MLASSTTKPGHHNNANQIQNMLYDQNMISVAPFHSQYFGVLQNLELIKKNENMTFLMKILQRLVLKHIYILSILNFPLFMEAAISHLSVT